MSIEDIKRFYPDLVARRGLANAVNVALRDVGSSLEVSMHGRPNPNLMAVHVMAHGRKSRIVIAKSERLFMFDLWRDGVMFGDGQTPDLHEMARAVKRWVGEGVSCEEFESTFAYVSLRSDAGIFERGEEVEEQWQSFLSSIHENHPELREFVEAAAAEPSLRQLFPFTSHNVFCLSRCTGYPYTGDIPSVRPRRDGEYEVIGANDDSLGVGTAEVAVSLVIAGLPAGCGPAVRGTANTVDGG